MKAALGGEQIRDCVRRAEAKRRAAFANRVLDAWRIVNGPGDGAPPGLTLDRYAAQNRLGAWLVLSARVDVREADVEVWCAESLRALDADGLVLKRQNPDPAQSSSRVVAGTLPGAPFRIREDDAVFLCDLNNGLPTGLYLDQRETRRRVRDFARGMDVLNLFAYTGAFSVHAALAGARRVTSVDASKKALRRGRENMIASGVDPDAHRWFPDDVPKHLTRAARKPPAYGLVILDPPSFGHGGRAPFSLDATLDDLILHAAATVSSGGILVVSVHSASVPAPRLTAAIAHQVAKIGRRLDIVEIAGAPLVDHPFNPTLGDEPLTTIIARLSD